MKYKYNIKMNSIFIDKMQEIKFYTSYKLIIHKNMHIIGKKKINILVIIIATFNI
jgi:hypothetical protein